MTIVAPVPSQIITPSAGNARRKPVGPLRLKRWHPSCRDLAFCGIPGPNGLVDLVTGITYPLAEGAIVPDTIFGGHMISYDGTTVDVLQLDSNVYFRNSREFAMLAAWRRPAGYSNEWGKDIGFWDPAGTQGLIYCFHESFGPNAQMGFFAGAGTGVNTVASNSDRQIGIMGGKRTLGSGRQVQAVINGTYAEVSAEEFSNDLVVGRLYMGDADQSDSHGECDISAIMLWRREMFEAELTYLYRNPFDLLESAVDTPYLKSAVSARSITAAQTEASEVNSADLDVVVQLAATQSEAAEADSADLDVLAQLTVSQAEASEVNSATINVLLELTAAQTEASEDQSASINATEARNVTAAQTEASEVNSADLDVVVQLAATQTESPEVDSASLQVVLQLTAAQVEAAESDAAGLAVVVQMVADQLEASDVNNAVVIVGEIVEVKNIAMGITRAYDIKVAFENRVEVKLN